MNQANNNLIYKSFHLIQQTLNDLTTLLKAIKNQDLKQQTISVESWIKHDYGSEEALNQLYYELLNFCKNQRNFEHHAFVKQLLNLKPVKKK